MRVRPEDQDHNKTTSLHVEAATSVSCTWCKIYKLANGTYGPFSNQHSYFRECCLRGLYSAGCSS
jgi:hypothetical protein